MYEPKSLNMVGAASQAGYPMDCDPNRVAEVPQALNSLRIVIERYDHLVGLLAGKLACVSISRPPSVQGQEKEGYQTDLANMIHSIRCKADSITDNLETLYQSIEL